MESTGNRRNSFCLDGRRQPSLGWHEPDESRGLRPDLWEARGEIPRAYPARGDRTKSNRTEAAWRKPRQSPPGGYRDCASSRLHSRFHFSTIRKNIFLWVEACERLLSSVEPCFCASSPPC